jgi:hypothetical protein
MLGEGGALALNPNKKTRGWYTVSVDTLRGVGILLVLLAVAAGGWYLFRRWESRGLEREAAALIDEVAVQIERARTAAPTADLEEVRSSQQTARERYDEREFRASVQHGRRALVLLNAIVDPSARASSGEAQFIAVQGGEFRRGEQGEWRRPGRDLLYSGDYVKRGRGSAESSSTARSTPCGRTPFPGDARAPRSARPSRRSR